MTGGAITMMVIGMIVLWGGLAASLAYAVKKAKQAKQVE
ncbi:methionine/alanine import family NSS transporter small subunit [Bacillus sp. REN16]|nr:methionine/alanine import family NSS transporter small subunit [Bacillus sp. REN16]MCC3355772.1 methionine/alanine import family NSS transporter small subunit [Bacillus sp. REN16]